jgi:nucleotide-binding universal stress UspA family protein
MLVDGKIQMPPIKKILFPVDFSDSCLSVARYVEAFAGRFEARILLLHVVGMGEGGLTLAEEQLPLKKAQLDAFLADELKYFPTERLCVTGDEPAPVIVDTALSWGADLVMMPTRGLGVFRSMLLGSVTAKILHDLDCPVWTSVHTDVVLPLEKIHCRRILCALDLSERSGSILEWAASLAAEYEAALGIVHSAAELPPAVISVGLEEELRRSLSDHAKKEIAELQAIAGTKAQVFVGSGDPGSAVAGAATDFAADLLVIGRHTGSGAAGYLRQNAYAILRDSPCPVISI